MAISTIPDGTYIIRNGASPYYALDVLANQTTNGTNVQVWARNNTQAQIWDVSTHRDGSRQILNRFSGKSIDIVAAQIQAGTNIQLWDDNDTVAQRWEIEETGSSITVDGTSYDTYVIRVTFTNFVATAVGTTEGSNVQIDTDTGSSRQEWIFEPIPLLQSGGVYEIRTYLNTRMGLEVVGGEANGANVQLNYGSDKNTMKFILAQESNGWSFYNAATGKYVDVDGAQAIAGANVQQWEDNDTRAQRWNIIPYGDTRVNGVKCLTCRIGSYVTSDGMTFMMDVSRSDSSAGNNVQIWGDLNDDAQLFVLVPSSAEDASMPVPYNLGLAKAVKQAGQPYLTSSDTFFYPTWKCSSAWVADGNNHYEFRYRRSYMLEGTNIWKYGGTTGWSNWSPWNTYGVTKDGNRVWLTQGFKNSYAEFNNLHIKNERFEFQVRAVGTDEYATLHSKTASQLVNIYRYPNVSIETSGQQVRFDPMGLHLNFFNDYSNGTAFITINKIYNDNVVVLDKPIRLAMHKTSETLTIPISKLKSIPTLTTSFTIEYQIGYDQYPKFDEVKKITRTIFTEFNGGTDDVTPVLRATNLRLYATVPDLGNTSCWVYSNDKKLFKCPVTRDYTNPSGYKVFDVPYMMNEENVIIVSSYSDDMTHYGGKFITWENNNIAYGFTTEDGHSVFLHKFVGAMPTMSRSRSSVYESDVLDSRKHESVSFTNTVKGTLTATGDLIKPMFYNGHRREYCKIEDFEQLEGKHVIFRDLYGGIWNVAVTAVNYERHEQYDRVTVTMIEESV